MFKAIGTHFRSAPFVAATAIGALIHSTWTLGTTFTGPQPNIIASPGTNEFIIQTLQYLAWMIPAGLVAVALDIGLLSTAHDIQIGKRNRAKMATFAVLAASMYFLQWIYVASHIPALQLAEGVTLGRPVAEFLTGAAVWIIPGLLPLSILLHTFGNAIHPTETQQAQQQPVEMPAAVSVERIRNAALPEPARAEDDTAEVKSVAFDGRGNPQQSRQCEHCGESFRTRNPRKKYCSSSCRASAAKARQNAVESEEINARVQESEVIQ